MDAQPAGTGRHRPATAFSCGCVVTAAQLLAGASGLLLDVFYPNSRLGRHAIVATKAITQTIGHLLKLAYYGISDPHSVPAWLIAVACLTAVAGTRIGTRLLTDL